MKRIEAIIRPERLGEVASNLEAKGLSGFTITDVRGHGTSPELTGEYRGNVYEMLVSHKLLVTLFVEDDEVDASVAAISAGAHTGQVGDGIITVGEVAAVYRIASAGAAGDQPPNANQVPSANDVTTANQTADPDQPVKVD